MRLFRLLCIGQQHFENLQEFSPLTMALNQRDKEVQVALVHMHAEFVVVCQQVAHELDLAEINEGVLLHGLEKPLEQETIIFNY